MNRAGRHAAPGSSLLRGELRRQGCERFSNPDTPDLSIDHESLQVRKSGVPAKTPPQSVDRDHPPPSAPWLKQNFRNTADALHPPTLPLPSPATPPPTPT